MDKELHVAMLPWSAFSHLMAFFHLAKALAKFGVQVSFVSTPRNIERLPIIPSTLASKITLVRLPMPKLQNGDLPEGAEATRDIPVEKMPQLHMAYDLLRDPFQKLVTEQSVDWIIIDMIPDWVIEIAQELHIPVMLFETVSAMSQSFAGPPQYLTGEGRVKVRPSMESLISPPPWINFPSSIALKRYEASAFYDCFYVSNGNRRPLLERLAKILKNCQAVSIRSCHELEGPYLDLLRKLLGKPVIPAGLLPPEKLETKEFIDTCESWKHVFTWLGEQTPKSVVFVAFGSELRLSKDQIHEIAYGLELSELPFLWALKEPTWAKDEAEALPAGFASRTRGRGMVHLGWVPQVEILGHQSIGGSLIHGGWSSIVESLEFGHHLVLLPLANEQSLNARLLVEKGFAMEIEREENGAFTRDDIARALKIAMVLVEGEALRVRAREAAAIFGDEKLQHEHYVGRLFQFLKSHKT